MLLDPIRLAEALVRHHVECHKDGQPKRPLMIRVDSDEGLGDPVCRDVEGCDAWRTVVERHPPRSWEGGPRSLVQANRCSRERPAGVWERSHWASDLVCDQLACWPTNRHDCSSASCGSASRHSEVPRIEVDVLVGRAAASLEVDASRMR